MVFCDLLDALAAHILKVADEGAHQIVLKVGKFFVGSIVHIGENVGKLSQFHRFLIISPPKRRAGALFPDPGERSPARFAGT